MDNVDSGFKPINPLSLIIAMILLTIHVSLDKNPYYPLAMILWSFVLSRWITDYTPLQFLYKLRVPVVVGVFYAGFILLGKHMARAPVDYLYTISLGLRFIAIASLSFIFIKTINPKLLVLSFIKYFKMTDAMGFAFLSAYRFFPSFKEELQQIKFSHAVRGIGASGPFAPIINMKNYTIPILVTAIRRGIRISVAMENRGFGKFETRTYYDELTMSPWDKKLLLMNILVISGGFFLLMAFGLIRIKGGY